MEQLKIQGRSPAVFMLADYASTFDVGMDFISLFLSCPGAAGKKRHIACSKMFTRQHLVFLLTLGASSLWSRLNQ